MGLLGAVLSVHLFGMVMWIGGLFAALLALGAARAGDSIADRELQSKLARRAMRALAHPGAAIMVLTGVWMIFIYPQWIKEGWLHIKLTLVVVLIILDLIILKRLGQVRQREIAPGTARAWHGVIWILFIAIVLLAVFKPMQ